MEGLEDFGKASDLADTLLEELTRCVEEGEAYRESQRLLAEQRGQLMESMADLEARHGLLRETAKSYGEFVVVMATCPLCSGIKSCHVSCIWDPGSKMRWARDLLVVELFP